MHKRALNRRAANRAITDKVEFNPYLLLVIPARIFLRYRFQCRCLGAFFETCQLVAVIGAHVQSKDRIGRDGIYRSAAAHGANCKGGLGQGRGFKLGNLGDGSAHRMNRTGQAEGTK